MSPLAWKWRHRSSESLRVASLFPCKASAADFVNWDKLKVRLQAGCTCTLRLTRSPDPYPIVILVLTPLSLMLTPAASCASWASL